MYKKIIRDKDWSINKFMFFLSYGLKIDTFYIDKRMFANYNDS